MALRHRHRLTIETLETRAFLAADSAPDAPSAQAILECFNRGDITDLAYDRSGDGLVSPLDALMVLDVTKLRDAQGESANNPVYQLFGPPPTGPAPDAPTTTAEIDEYFRGTGSVSLLGDVANPDGVTPTSYIRGYYAFRDDPSFSIPLHWLGDDPDDSIYNSQIEFLNLPTGWTVTPKLQIDFAADAPKLPRYDLRFRFIDRAGNVSNTSVLRLTFINVSRPYYPGQNPVNQFDTNDDGLVNYADLLTVERKLGPQQPNPVRATGVICMKYCESYRPPGPSGTLTDVNGDSVVTTADLDMLRQHLQQTGVPQLRPTAFNTVIGTPIPGTDGVIGGWRAGTTVTELLSSFGHDPDGDGRSFTVELLSEAPFTLEQSSSGVSPDSVRVHTQASASGFYKVRFQLPDIQGLVSDPAELTVYIAPQEPSAFQNTVLASDVDGDGITTPLDAMKLIMLLNTGSQVPQIEPAAPILWDVDGDGQLSPLDALLVMIALNTDAVT